VADFPVLKTCGLMDVATSRVAVDAGATALGFMFAPSRRNITPGTARGIIEQLDEQRDHRPAAVGVVVNETPRRLALLAEESGVDVLQLSGDEQPGMLDALDGEIWKTVRFGAGVTADSARRVIASWLDRSRPVSAVLVDAAVAGAYGGTGHRADWALVARLAEEWPIVLAGGLDPGNVAEAIASVRPAGVDVSSGIERDGVKDPHRIQAFLQAAASAFREHPPRHQA
jgi:phosphoribosylanthranilate isomerase